MAEPVLTQANPIFHESTEGGVRYSPASGHSKELAKWETRPLEDGSVTQKMIDTARAAGVHHGVWEFKEFPKCLYRAEQTNNGIKMVESQPVHSLEEQHNLESRGFRESQEKARAYVEDQNFAVAEAAANRAFYDRRMTETAQREAAAADNATMRHVGAIPETPRKPRGRPKTAPAQESPA